jgi:hypothetical protein
VVRRLFAQNWVLAMLSAGVAPLLYFGVRTQLESMGYIMYPMWVSIPDTLELLWPVAPGAFLAALLLDYTLGPFRRGTLLKRLGWGTLLGAVLGWANAPFSVLVCLWLYVGQGSQVSLLSAFQIWVQCIPAILFLAMPVALPCGAVLGILVAALGALDEEGVEGSQEKP